MGVEGPPDFSTDPGLPHLEASSSVPHLPVLTVGLELSQFQGDLGVLAACRNESKVDLAGGPRELTAGAGALAGGCRGCSKAVTQLTWGEGSEDTTVQRSFCGCVTLSGPPGRE